MVLEFGALTPPLHKQLGVSSGEVKLFQRLADSIVLLSVQGILTGVEKSDALRRLTKKMEKELK